MKRIDIDKAKEEYSSLSVPELHKESIRIASKLNHSLLNKNYKIAAIKELLKEKKCLESK